MSNIPDFVEKANTEPNTKIVFAGMDNEGHYVYMTEPATDVKIVGGGSAFICTKTKLIKKLVDIEAMMFIDELP